MKHNKKRNTAILYEVLTQQLTKAVIDKDKSKKQRIASVLRSFFSTGKIMNRELELYKALYETRGLEEGLCIRLVQEVAKAHAALDQKEIYKEQSKLIDVINKEVSKSAFQAFIPNYKCLASISQMFNPSVTIKNKVLLEKQIVDYMSVTKLEDKKDLVPIDNIVYTKFVEKFNDKYSDHLLEEQKTLLSKYISSFADNGVELKIYLNEEIERLKEEMASCITLKEFIDDSHMQEKAKKVVELLDSTSTRAVNTALVEDVVKIQSLVKEIRD